MSLISRSTSLIAIHILGILGFLALPYLLDDSGFAKLTELAYNTHEQRNLLSYVLTIAFFYVNFYVLIPKLFFRRRYVAYGAAVLGCFVLINFTLTTINRGSRQPDRRLAGAPPASFPSDLPPSGQPPMGNRPPNAPPPMDGRPGDRPPYPQPSRSESARAAQPGLPSEISQTLLLFLAGLLLSIAIRINDRWRETERQRLDTELSYLKAQINPHFLFNTLNSIYSLAIERSFATADAIVQLSSLLRYVITEGRQDQVTLTHELAYIGHYISLQRLRIADTVALSFTTQGVPNGMQIAPLLLISFIENAFKYGVSPQEPSRIDIRIELTPGQLVCYVFNQKVRVAEASAQSSGIGLSNTKARLQLLYPGRHELVIRDQPDSFTVELTLTLT